MAQRESRAALSGLLCGAPFLAANAIVAGRVEPFFSMIRPGPHTSAREIVLLAVVLLLLPLGAYVAARPMLKTRQLVVANCAVAALLLAGFATIAVALGIEIFRCEILHVTNCD